MQKNLIMIVQIKKILTQGQNKRRPGQKMPKHSINMIHLCISFALCINIYSVCCHVQCRLLC